MRSARCVRSWPRRKRRRKARTRAGSHSVAAAPVQRREPGADPVRPHILCGEVELDAGLEDQALGQDEAFAEALARGFASFVAFLGASTMDATAIGEPLLRGRVDAAIVGE